MIRVIRVIRLIRVIRVIRVGWVTGDVLVLHSLQPATGQLDRL